jgi:hypothetical protein
MVIGRLSWAPTKFCDDLGAITFESTTLPDLVADIAQNERDASKGQRSHRPSNRVHLQSSELAIMGRNLACRGRRAMGILAGSVQSGDSVL